MDPNYYRVYYLDNRNGVHYEDVIDNDHLSARQQIEKKDHTNHVLLVFKNAVDDPLYISDK